MTDLFKRRSIMGLGATGLALSLAGCTALESEEEIGTTTASQLGVRETPADSSEFEVYTLRQRDGYIGRRDGDFHINDQFFEVEYATGETTLDDTNVSEATYLIHLEDVLRERVDVGEIEAIRSDINQAIGYAETLNSIELEETIETLHSQFEFPSYTGGRVEEFNEEFDTNLNNAVDVLEYFASFLESYSFSEDVRDEIDDLSDRVEEIVQRIRSDMWSEFGEFLTRMSTYNDGGLPEHFTFVDFEPPSLQESRDFLSAIESQEELDWAHAAYNIPYDSRDRGGIRDLDGSMFGSGEPGGIAGAIHTYILTYREYLMAPLEGLSRSISALSDDIFDATRGSAVALAALLNIPADLCEDMAIEVENVFNFIHPSYRAMGTIHEDINELMSHDIEEAENLIGSIH